MFKFQWWLNRQIFLEGLKAKYRDFLFKYFSYKLGSSEESTISSLAIVQYGVSKFGYSIAVGSNRTISDLSLIYSDSKPGIVFNFFKEFEDRKLLPDELVSRSFYNITGADAIKEGIKVYIFGLYALPDTVELIFDHAFPSYEYEKKVVQSTFALAMLSYTSFYYPLMTIFSLPITLGYIDVGVCKQVVNDVAACFQRGTEECLYNQSIKISSFLNAFEVSKIGDFFIGPDYEQDL